MVPGYHPLSIIIFSWKNNKLTEYETADVVSMIKSMIEELENDVNLHVGRHNDDEGKKEGSHHSNKHTFPQSQPGDES